ncbi:hypothetical protein [Nesterenkonia pannonica]|uniref:hypothetical protein n=1 Tax=Nesterenkonia pannonica TaxID=1548602 RepID=UPI0021645A12|nr:hypothetical protein [Nesterenkonia pannonica]
MAHMGVVKKSVSLPEETYLAVKDLAEAEGLSVSTWLAQVAEVELKHREGMEAIAEFEAEFGAFTQEELAGGYRLFRQLTGRPIAGDEGNSHAEAEERKAV